MESIESRVHTLQSILLKIGIVFLNRKFAPNVRQYMRMCGRQFRIVYSTHIDDTHYIVKGITRDYKFVVMDEAYNTQEWVIDPLTGTLANLCSENRPMYLKYQ